jgi:hypothetical protein
MRGRLIILIAMFGLALGSPAHALESGATCDIEDDTAHLDLLKELERILKELSKPTS